MSTRSMICVMNKTTKLWNVVYCHFDGYPEHVGNLLLRNYGDYDKAMGIIKLGGCSVLGPTLQDSTFYSRDRNEPVEDNRATPYATKKAIKESAGSYGAEYIYFFDGVLDLDRKWTCLDAYTGKIPPDFTKLCKTIKKENKPEPKPKPEPKKVIEPVKEVEPMKNQPALKDILEVIVLKEKAKEIYKEVDEKMRAIFEKYGDGRFDFDMGTPDRDGKQFMVFNVINNIKKMQNGEDIFTAASIKPLTFETRMNKTDTSKK